MEAHKFKEQYTIKPKSRQELAANLTEKILSAIKLNDLDVLYVELENEEDELRLKLRKKKSAAEKKKILAELAGSGLQYGKEVIEESLRIAHREDEEDREV
ncbi:hypothetical protein [Effusibacillus lacus]|uniref:Uncharacterized protein n=1 Tax=Effusibacillus lacus TaxID=1348429 RepID=A0A292YLX1_9BACL|nr:hypothetical protein [Effusibacillus lacus]TCS68283.1 hypothetical protein EDD64_14429 [Effusibacillus lacus]GAX90166.1 hypothetical protein EFBL_1792 [Effusibacillus lacus]